MNSKTADIVIIGGGIIGASVAFYLAEALPDASIVVLDRGPMAGASSGSCMGHLMVTPANQRAYRLTRTSVDLWARLAERVPTSFELNQTGCLYLADVDDDLPLLLELQRQFESRGDAAEVLDNRQLRDLEPGLAEDIPGALLYGRDGVVMPMLAVGAILRGAQSAGRVEVRPHCAVHGVEIDGTGSVEAVRTDVGSLATRSVVNAAGVWSPDVAEMVGLPRLPIHPRRGDLAITGHHTTPIWTQLLEVAYLRVAHGASQVDPTRTDEDPGAQAMNVQPQSSGSCLIGSTRQFAGMKRVVNRELLHRSLLRSARYVPALREAQIVRTWAGLRPFCTDGRPVIGPVPGVQGFYLAAGHEGLGITLSQVTGTLIAQCIVDETPTVPLEPYLPSRFFP